MNTKYVITQSGSQFVVRDAAGTLVALATFPMPRRPENCADVMRERAAFLCRFDAPART